MPAASVCAVVCICVFLCAYMEYVVVHIRVQVNVFVCMCVRMYAYAHVEGDMVTCVCSGQGGASCNAIYVYKQMWAPEPQSHQSSNYQRHNITGQYGMKLHGCFFQVTV